MLAAFVLCWPACPSFAQTGVASLNGSVLDASGGVLPSARVLVTNTATAVSRQVTASGDGRFTIELPPGTYTIRAELDGFGAAVYRDVVLNVGDARSIEMRLAIASLGETVAVRGSAVLLNESPSVRAVVDRHFIEHQPLNGRSFLSLIELMPGTVLAPTVEGVQGDFSVGGQLPGSNYFTVDGVSGNFGIASSGFLTKAGGSYPAYSVQGTTATLASVDAVQEFAVQTSAVAPEFGRQPGAQVSIVTRSGSNDLHGGLFEYFRHDALDANDYFANANGLPKQKLRQSDFGLTVGGPVRRERTFFFASYEGLRLRQPAVTSPQAVPSLEARARATGLASDILAAFPLPTGTPPADDPLSAPFVGGYSNPSSLDAASVRIDHVASPNVTIFGRASVAPSEVSQRVPYGVGTANSIARTSSRAVIATAGVTHILSGRVVNDLRVNFSRATTEGGYTIDGFGGANPPPDAVLFAPGLATRESASGAVGIAGRFLYYGPYFDNRQDQWNVTDTLTMQRGAHSVKVGVDYRVLPVAQHAPSYQRFLIYDGTGAVLADMVSSVLVGRSDFTPRPTFDNLSAYAQDIWQARRNLTLTYGVRYELAPPPRFPAGGAPYTVTGVDHPETAVLASAGSRLYRTRALDFAPRFGLSFQPPGGRTIVRGGIGVFYDLAYSYLGNALNVSVLPFGGFASSGGISVSDPFMTTLPSQNDLSPYYGVTAYAADYKTPYSLQYNVAIERAPTGRDTVTVAYVGSQGRRLQRLESRQVPGGVAGINTTRLDVIRNDGRSEYDALIVQYSRRLSRGLQVLASYNLARANDNAPASDVSVYAPLAPADRYDPDRDWGPAGTDARHTFSAAVSYALPSPPAGVGRALLGGFWIDSILRARSATPVNVVSGDDPLGLGLIAVYRPDLVPGVPMYLSGASYPGGRRINPEAFVASASGGQGTLARNAVRGFGASQLDLSLRRQFRLAGRTTLQLRVDSFNVLNHPSFANPVNSLYAGGVANIQDESFGLSTQMLGRGWANSGGGVSPLYQIGGPRSFQASVKLGF